MSRLTNSKKIKLLKIEKAKATISKCLNNGTIKEQDIISLFNKNVDYGLTIDNEKTSNKECLLKEIFNCPFLLCDQEHLSLETKKMLPLFLEKRYKIEEENLNYYYENGYISKEDYIRELDELLFVYYKSSNDGKKILQENQVEKIKTI